MKTFDAVIIGGSTTGSYFARRLAEKGLSVLIIEKDKKEDISPAYDVFHMGRRDMLRFGLPMPEKTDSDYCFEFEDGCALSAFGHFPKATKNPVVGMHKHLYILRLNDWAVRAGAEIRYEAEFKEFIFSDNGKIAGVKYKKNNRTYSVGARLVADCSGIPAVARTTLPENYGVETFELTPDDIFYVVLRYISFAQKRPSKWLRNDSWLFYKTWMAPSNDDDGALLGVGSNFGFDYAEGIFELFTKNVTLPEYTVKKIERGCTPYHRPPYSFVGDGFIAMGDAACLTKPFNGEGCTSSLVQADIAVDVISEIILNGEAPSRDNMWSINKRYVEAQGKSFASTLATFIGAVKHGAADNEYLFKHDIIFSKKMFSGVSGGIAFSVPDIVKTAFFIATGIITGKLNAASIRNIVAGALNGGKVSELYGKFPDTPEGFEDWVSEAELLWEKIGKMADWKLLDVKEKLKAVPSYVMKKCTVNQ